MDNSIVEQYTQQKLLFQKFSDKLDLLITEILNANNIYPHQIICRVKEKDSLSSKISRKKDKYNSLTDITDIVGLRIISYFEDDVDKIAKIIEKELKVDLINSIDKRILEADKFGYRSLHYVVSLSEERLKLTENKIFINLKAEIQVRSILQHAWAEIEHDIGYKGEIEIPNFAKRSFYRIAALLETADIEFVKLKDTLKQYESEVSKSIEQKPEKVLLDKASLTNYIKNSILVDEIETNICKLINSGKRNKKFEDFNIILERLSYLNISTIKDLELLLQKYKNQIPIFVQQFPGNNSIMYRNSLPQGISLFYLAYILSSKDMNLAKTIEFCEKFKLGDTVAQRLIATYKESHLQV